jgi:hypothetical protein
MKLIFTWVFILMNAIIRSQQLPNSSFESWSQNSQGILTAPESWIELTLFQFCNPNPTYVTPSTEANSGLYSALLESSSCFLEGGIEIIQVAKLRTGDGGLDPHYFSLSYSARPDAMQFNYKFHQEGSDSAFVRLMLFRWDTLENQISDTIAFVSGWINEETTEFQTYTLPIEYMTELTPEYIRIEFSSSKTLTEQSLGYTPPGMYASVGTKFWIDDIQMIGGDVAVEEETETNPIELMRIGDAIRIMSITGVPLNIELFSSDSKLVYSRAKQTNYQIENLPSGIYVLKVMDDSGILVGTRKFGI